MNILPYIFTLLIMPFALAESPSITLASLESMKRGEEEAQKICSNLKNNPNCVENLELMKNVLGLNVVACEARKTTLKCNQIIRNYPEYKNKIMRCEPYEVCRQALNTTMANGCKKYGIQVKDDFLSAFKNMNECRKDFACMGQQAKQTAKMAFMPGLVLYEVIRDTFSGVKDDINKFNDLNCFDVDTQAQFTCYMMVKYGMAVTGVAGASRVAAGAVIARMTTLETVLKAGARLPPTPALKVSSISQRLGDSGKFRMFAETRQEVPFDSTVLKPGESYTVLVHDGKIIFGDKYRNAEGGTARTHLMLDKDVTGEFRLDYEGGAVRINADGSIDVSGYRMATKSPVSEKLIVDALREVLPEARIRSTPGRLSELPDITD